MKSFLKVSLAVACMMAPAARARADVLIFDNYSSSVGNYDGTTYRDPDDSPGTYISNVSTNTTISEIGVLTNQAAAGNYKFLIADDATGTILFTSAAQAFGADAGDAMTWKVSNPFSFTLLAGHQYDIGYIADTETNVPYAFPGFSYTQGGITSSSNNSNFSSFDNPTDAPQSGATTIPLELFGPSSAVPEPGSMALAAVGLGALIVARRVRSRTRKCA
jgi:hypothetical protein